MGEGKTDGPPYGWKPKAATGVKGHESVKQQRNAAIMNIILCGNRLARVQIFCMQKVVERFSD